MEVRRQQANYRCTLYRLQFCGSFQDMCRCRAFQMLHTKNSHHRIRWGHLPCCIPRGMAKTKAQTCPQKNAGQQSTCSSQSRCCVSWEGYRIPEAVEPWADPGPWDGLLWCHGSPGEGNPHISSLRQTWQFCSVPHLYEVFHVFPFEIKTWLVSLMRMNFP